MLNAAVWGVCERFNISLLKKKILLEKKSLLEKESQSLLKKKKILEKENLLEKNSGRLSTSDSPGNFAGRAVW